MQPSKKLRALLKTAGLDTIGQLNRFAGLNRPGVLQHDVLYSTFMHSLAFNTACGVTKDNQSLLHSLNSHQHNQQGELSLCTPVQRQARPTYMKYIDLS